MDKDELYTATQYIVVIMLHQYFYPVDLSTATADEINNAERCVVERYRADVLFHARVDKLTHLLVDKTLSLLAPVLADAEKWENHQQEIALANAAVDRFVTLMQSDEDKLRTDAEKWRKLMSLFDTSCDKCFLGHVCGTHRRSEAVCEDIKDALEGEVKG